MLLLIALALAALWLLGYAFGLGGAFHALLAAAVLLVLARVLDYRRRTLGY